MPDGLSQLNLSIDKTADEIEGLASLRKNPLAIGKWSEADNEAGSIESLSIAGGWPAESTQPTKKRGILEEGADAFLHSLGPQNIKMFGAGMRAMGTKWQSEALHGAGFKLEKYGEGIELGEPATMPPVRDIESALRWSAGAIGQGLGSTVPPVVAGAVGAGAGAGAGLAAAGPAGAAAGATAGGVTGAFSVNHVLMSGEAMTQFEEEGVDSLTAAEATQVIAPMMAGLDTLGILKIMQGPKRAKKGILKYLGQRMAHGASVEAATEMAQGVIRELTAAELTGDTKLAERTLSILEEGAAAALTGGVLGGAAAPLTRKQSDKAPEATPEAAPDATPEATPEQEVADDALAPVEPEVEVAAEPAPVVEPEVVVEPAPVVEPEPVVEPVPEVAPVPEPEAEADPALVADPEAAAEPVLDPTPEATPEAVDAAAVPEPEPTPEPAPQPQQATPDRVLSAAFATIETSSQQPQSLLDKYEQAKQSGDMEQAQEVYRLAEQNYRGNYVEPEAAPEPTPEPPAGRHAFGRKATKEERDSILSTIADTYVENEVQQVPVVDTAGNERYRYPHTPDTFLTSDITGAKIRHYVTLPDGKVAHPSELFPDLTNEKIKKHLAKAKDKRRQTNEWVDQQERHQFDTAEEANDYWNQIAAKGGSRSADRRVRLYKEGKQILVDEDNKADTFAELKRRGWSEERSVTDTDVTPPSMVKGRPGQMRTSRGEKYDLDWAVVSADELVASNDFNGVVNPEYPQDLQPRDRTERQSRIQMSNIAAEPNPTELGETGVADTGAPAVRSDGVVLSGNGRTIGLRQAYKQGTAEQYRAFVQEQAENFGIPPEDLAKAGDKPVLVRVVDPQMSKEEQLRFSRDANVSGVAQMAAGQQAKTDAKAFEAAEIMQYYRPDEQGEVTSVSNREFLRAAMTALGQSASGLTDDEGMLTRQGADRIEAAAFHTAYDNDKLTRMVSQAVDPERKNILTALKIAAPAFARARSFSQDFDGIDVAGTIVEGMELLRKVAESPQFTTLQDLLDQASLFGDQASPASVAMAKFIDKNRRSAKRMGAAFRTLAERVEDAIKNPISLMNTAEDRSIEGIIEQTIEIERQAEQGGLQFGEEPEPLDDPVPFGNPQPGGLFSIRPRNDRLRATHSLTLSELTQSMNKGGLVAPSIAITPDNVAHEYGEGKADVIFKSGAIKPGRDNVTAGDAYTPTYPPTERVWKGNQKQQQEMVERFRSDLESLPADVREDEAIAEVLGQRYMSLTDGYNRLEPEEYPNRPAFHALYRRQTGDDSKWVQGPEYEAWLENYLFDISGGKVTKSIRVGSDSMGRPRYKPANPENVIRAMKAEMRDRPAPWSPTEVAARLTPVLRTVKQMRQAAQDRVIGRTDDPEGQVAGFDRSLAEALDQAILEWPLRFSESSTLVDELYEQRGDPDRAAARVMQWHDVDPPPTGWSDKVRQALDAMHEGPLAYLEAKPMRVVPFDDVAAVLLPPDASPEIRQRLETRGIQVLDKTEGMDSQALAQLQSSAPDSLFSIADNEVTPTEQNHHEQITTAVRSVGEKVIAAGRINGINVVETIDDLPDELREQALDQAGDVEGAFIPELNEVYLVSSNLESADRAVEVFLHETVAHFGLREVFGDQLNDVLDDIASRADQAQMREIAKLYGFNLKNEGQRRVAAEEYIARIAESMGTEPAGESPRLDKTLWRKLVDAIKKLLRDMGVLPPEAASTEVDEYVRNMLVEVRAKIETPNPRNLRATHNIRSASNFEAQVMKGNFVAPSIAIQERDKMNEWGRIEKGDGVSVVFKPEAIRWGEDPVFPDDAYTPTFPSINRMVKENAPAELKAAVVSAVSKTLQEAGVELDSIKGSMVLGRPLWVLRTMDEAIVEVLRDWNVRGDLASALHNAYLSHPASKNLLGAEDYFQLSSGFLYYMSPFSDMPGMKAFEKEWHSTGGKRVQEEIGGPKVAWTPYEEVINPDGGFIPATPENIVMTMALSGTDRMKSNYESGELHTILSWKWPEQTFVRVWDGKDVTPENQKDTLRQIARRLGADAPDNRFEGFGGRMARIETVKAAREALKVKTRKSHIKRNRLLEAKPMRAMKLSDVAYVIADKDKLSAPVKKKLSQNNVRLFDKQKLTEKFRRKKQELLDTVVAQQKEYDESKWKTGDLNDQQKELENDIQNDPSDQQKRAEWERLNKEIVEQIAVSKELHGKLKKARNAYNGYKEDSLTKAQSRTEALFSTKDKDKNVDKIGRQMPMMQYAVREAAQEVEYKDADGNGVPMSEVLFSVKPPKKPAKPPLIELRRPFESFFRTAFSVALGGRDEQGNIKVTKKMHDAAVEVMRESRPTPGSRWSWIDPYVTTARHGWFNRYNTPTEFMARERQRHTDEFLILREMVGYIEELHSLGVNAKEAKAFNDMLTKGEPLDDSRMQNLGERIRESIDQMGKEMVEAGILSEDSWRRNLGEYMHRSYMKYEFEQPDLVKWMRARGRGRRASLIGDELKRQGLTHRFGDVQRLVGDIRPEFKDEAENYDQWHVTDLVDPDTGKVRRRLYAPVGKDEWLTEEGAGLTGKDTWESVDQGQWEIRRGGGGRRMLWRQYTEQEFDAMGLIRDARFNIIKTYQLMAHDVSTGKFYQDVAANPDWFQVDKPHGNIGTPRAMASGFDAGTYTEYDWVKVPDEMISKSNTKKWGALAGGYLKPELWRDLTQLNQMQNPGWWGWIMRAWKESKTVLTPTVHFNNVAGNVILSELYDFEFGDIRDGLLEFARKGDMYQEALAHGIFDSGYVDTELHRVDAGGKIEKIIKEVENAGAGQSSWGAIADVFGKLRKGMQNAYRFEDEIFRLMSYMRDRDRGMDKDEAATNAINRFMNYDIRAPWPNALRRTVLPFFSYTYSFVPQMVKAIANKPWKVAKLFSLGYVIQALSREMIGGDEEEERQIMAERDKGYTWSGLPKMLRLPIEQDGQPVYLGMRRLLPGGGILETDNNLIGVPEWMAIGGPLLIAGDMLWNRAQFSGEDIVNNMTDTYTEKASKRMGYIWRAAMPNMPIIPGSWNWQQLTRAFGDDVDMFGREYSPTTAVIRQFGPKLYPFDMDAQRASRIMELSSEMRDIESQMMQMARLRARGRIGEGTYERRRKSAMKKLERIQARAQEILQ